MLGFLDELLLNDQLISRVCYNIYFYYTAFGREDGNFVANYC